MADCDRRPTALVITCEHAGREVPAWCAAAFHDAEQALASHRGYDPGALELATAVAGQCAAPLHLICTSRLVIECNRSIDHPELFSPFALRLSPAERQRLIDEHYTPHRAAVRATIAAFVAGGTRVHHVGMHTFVDVLAGAQRQVDIGLLFDPGRRQELEWAGAWRRRLEAARPDLRIRFNEPYLGIDDGLVTALRVAFDDDDYAGIEVEVRQGLLTETAALATIAGLLAGTLRDAGRPTRR